MSNRMLLGVLRIPIDAWRNEPLDNIQRHSRYKQAANKIEHLEAVLLKCIQECNVPNKILEEAFEAMDM